MSGVSKHCGNQRFLVVARVQTLRKLMRSELVLKPFEKNQIKI